MASAGFESQETLAPTDLPFKYTASTQEVVWEGRIVRGKSKVVQQQKKESAPTAAPVKEANGAAGVRVGQIVRAQYRTTNANTKVGFSTRTLLVLRPGKSDETNFHKAHLPVKDGYWCVHGEDVKFMVKSRFISSEVIPVVDALRLPDTPVVLRTELTGAVNRALNTLRKLNSFLSGVDKQMHVRADMTIAGNSF